MMKKIFLFSLMIFATVLIGCKSSPQKTDKILGLIELNKTPIEEIGENLNLEVDAKEVWDEELGIWIYEFLGYYADYTLNNVDGIIRINTKDDIVCFVSFSAEATSENMDKILSYLVDIYGKNYKEVEDYTTRWYIGEMVIDYALTNEDNVEIIWYSDID